MPLDRFLHAVAGHSDKVNRLNDFEFRVWTQYLLSADDFGVMRFSAAPLQADNDRLADASARNVQKAIEALLSIGLVQTFEHQGRVFMYQPTWQTFQKVEYPRRTTAPAPDPATCDDATQTLLSVHPGGKRIPKVTKIVSESLGEDLSNPREVVSSLARAGAPQRLTANANGERLEANGQRPTAVAPIRQPRSMGAGGTSPAQHIGHGRCNDRGVCMPTALYAEILGRFANDVSRFDAFYESILAQMPDDFVPAGSVFRFWHDMLERAHPNLTPKVNARQAAMEADF